MSSYRERNESRVIVFILGTSAEAIKVQPVMRRLRDRGVEFEIWSTYQHTEALDKALISLDLPKPTYRFARGAKGHPIERPAQMIRWLSTCFVSLIRNRKSLRSRLPAGSLIVVHGDTVTTVFGACSGKILKTPVAHVEAGLRSGKLTRPFPEEIDRRIVGKLATIHFPPNQQAADNLKGKDAVNTLRNTAVDGVLDVLTDGPGPLKGKYGLVLLHRFELISQPNLVKQTIQTLVCHTKVPLVVLTDAYSGGPINEAIEELESNMVTVSGKLDYPNFVNAMARAEFIFTDSGGIQQEAGLLGVPTMLHRQVTESPDGMGANILLSHWDLGNVKAFLENYDAYRRDMEQPERSPSDIIIESLSIRGYLS